MKLSKILMVEDSEADQFYNKAIVETFDSSIKILQAYDGQEALDMLAGCDSQPDLIFLDINLPDISGLSFLRTLKNPPTIIMTTAYPDYAVESFEFETIIDY